jgi:predicted O-methyltransferase YrrM
MTNNPNTRASSSYGRLMMSRVKNAIRTVTKSEPLKITWRKQGGTLSLRPDVPHAPRKLMIEDRAWKTNASGHQPLAQAYGDDGATRAPSDVRSASRIGDLFAWLMTQRKPKTVVEFGSAFGVSGMYFLSGLHGSHGHLFSYEINPVWADFARQNMAAMSDQFTLTLGAFEDHVGKLTAPIDVAFIDGIHTSDFIHRQYEIIRPLASPGALLMFDDIDFPSGDMQRGWEEIWAKTEVTAACEINDHVGIIELAK